MTPPPKKLKNHPPRRWERGCGIIKNSVAEGTADLKGLMDDENDNFTNSALPTPSGRYAARGALFLRPLYIPIMVQRPGGSKSTLHEWKATSGYAKSLIVCCSVTDSSGNPSQVVEYRYNH
jgi:hypothetical protein